VPNKDHIVVFFTMCFCFEHKRAKCEKNNEQDINSNEAKCVCHK